MLPPAEIDSVVPEFALPKSRRLWLLPNCPEIGADTGARLYVPPNEEDAGVVSVWSVCPSRP